MYSVQCTILNNYVTNTHTHTHTHTRSLYWIQVSVLVSNHTVFTVVTFASTTRSNRSTAVDTVDFWPPATASAPAAA